MGSNIVELDSIFRTEFKQINNLEENYFSKMLILMKGMQYIAGA